MAVRARWERAEAIALYPSAGNPTIVATHRRDVETTVFSQRLFLPAPRGAHLAYSTPTALRLRDGRGRELSLTDWRDGDYRFRADGGEIVAVTGAWNERMVRSFTLDGE